MMADLRDEYGNPIQLTDEHGNPVQLYDEHGNPMHLTGVATTQTTAHGVESGEAAETGGAVEHDQHREGETDELNRYSSSSSSSGSSEDDGQGGRRKKKKGLKEKIKEKLGGGSKHKDELGEHGQSTSPVGSATTTTTSTTTSTQNEHEKKSMIEKIKEKLPGHHSH